MFHPISPISRPYLAHISPISPPHLAHISAQDLNLRGKLLSIGSTNGSAATVIDCGGTSRLITFNNSEPRAVRLTGLTVRNCGGAADGKGAVLVTGDAAPLIGD